MGLAGLSFAYVRHWANVAHSQVKFFDFVNKAQVKAAQRLSAALQKSPAGDGDWAGDKEDFFHVIQAAAALGIAEEDCGNIWAD